MVAESWILKMGSEVSFNLKQTLLLHPSKKSSVPKSQPAAAKTQKQTVSILSFEIANVMSKTIHFHKSFTDYEISKLKNEILKSEGVLNLVFACEAYLLELAMKPRKKKVQSGGLNGREGGGGVLDFYTNGRSISIFAAMKGHRIPNRSPNTVSTTATSPGTI
ncbi:hypothetical protein EV2_035050 [Malus domestica]